MASKEDSKMKNFFAEAKDSASTFLKNVGDWFLIGIYSLLGLFSPSMKQKSIDLKEKYSNRTSAKMPSLKKKDKSTTEEAATGATGDKEVAYTEPSNLLDSLSS